jgi:hypothetical protein
MESVLWDLIAFFRILRMRGLLMLLGGEGLEMRWVGVILRRIRAFTRRRMEKD